MAKYYEINQENEPRPYLPSWIERDLAGICRDQNVDVRLVWAPDRERREMLGFMGNPSGYLGKVYANPGLLQLDFRGWLHTQGLQKILGFRSMDKLPKKFPQRWGIFVDDGFGNCQLKQLVSHYDKDRDEWWIPQVENKQIAYSRWLLEYRDDSEMKAGLLEEKSFDPVTLELIQEVAADPSGCWWSLGPFIAEHNGLCCFEANANRELCPGKPRPPAERDIEALQRAIQERNRAGQWRGLGENNRLAAAQAYQKLVDQERKDGEELLEHYKEITQNAIAPALNTLQLKSIGGVNKPRHTTPIRARDLLQIQKDIRASARA